MHDRLIIVFNIFDGDLRKWIFVEVTVVPLKITQWDHIIYEKYHGSTSVKLIKTYVSRSGRDCS